MMRLPSDDQVGKASQAGSEVNRVVFSAGNLEQPDVAVLRPVLYLGVRAFESRSLPHPEKLSECGIGPALPTCRQLCLACRTRSGVPVRASRGSRFPLLPGRLLCIPLSVDNQQRHAGAHHKDQTRKGLPHCELPSTVYSIKNAARDW